MPALRAVPVALTAAERKTLKKRARGAKTAYRGRQPAQIVLLAARRWPTAAIAARLGIVQDTARKWRARFPPRRPDGPADAPRSRRPPPAPPPRPARNRAPARPGPPRPRGPPSPPPRPRPA